MAQIVSSNPAIRFWYVNSRDGFSPTSTPKDGVLYFGLEWENDYGFWGVKYDLHKNFLNKIDEEFKVNHRRQKIHWHKRDGSLNTNGAETVTAPMTYNAMMKWLGIMHDKNIETKTSHARGGIHVHVNRSYFSNASEIANVIYFVNNMRDFFYKISKRNLKSVGWGKYRKITYSYAKNIALGRERTEKYSCVNTRPSNTLEFRMFRTESKPQDVAYIIKMVKLICDFCKKTDMSSGEIDRYKEQWFNYLKENKEMLSPYYLKFVR